jgi:copper chaperone
MMKKEFSITGMNCQHCAGKVKNALESMDAIQNVTVLKDDNSVIVEADQVPSVEELNAVLGDYGHYQITGEKHA